MGQALAFYTLAAFILGFGVLVITARNTVHSIMFLVVDFLFIAALYVLLGAQFLAVIQVVVYAGGIVVLYLFVVMLVNLKRPPEAHKDRRRRGRLGLIVALVVFVERIAGRGAAARHGPGARQRRAGRHAAVHGLPGPVRTRVDPAARGNGRRDRPGPAGTVAGRTV
jgi:NADH:ubiquinone oxidoreductase subunit 6 (subunit J)